MFRSSFIYLSKAAWARNIVSKWRVARRTASRFVAGESLKEALLVVKKLDELGFYSTLDHLGEHTSNPQNAINAKEDILRIIDAVSQPEMRVNVSIKLTQIGLALDKNLCESNLREIVTFADQKSNFVRIDMEDSPWTNDTLELYWKLREEYQLNNVGLVIQSYLFRSEKDVENILKSNGKIRLCKGAYKEPKNIAYPDKKDVDHNFDRIVKKLIDASLNAGSSVVKSNGRFPPICAVASHDNERLEFAKEYARKVGLSKNEIEFQMLYGIRRDLQNQYLQEGFPVRIYIPYGTEWYPYFTRRLAERPANLWFFVSNLFKN